MSWPTNYPDSPDDTKKFAESSTAPSPSGLLKDFKVGFTLAVKNILSFGLAMLGILLVTLLLLVLIALFILIPVLFTMGIPFLIWFVESIVAGFSVTSGLTLVMLIMFLVLPLLGPFFIALGALFGMARELVESDGTQAESAFSWYGKRGFSLLGGGMIHFLITLAPLILAFLSISYPTWNPPTNQELEILIPLIVVWIILVNGMLSLTFPGIIDGLSAVKAAARSIRLACQFPGRVLGAWFIIVLMIGLPILPIINELAFLWEPLVIFHFFEQYSGLVIIILLFVVVPAVSIVLTRIYMILTAKVDATYTQEGGGE
ncbi:MAG: hypothetical protein AM326_05135 [Candidatus Thorarchaeota archaeon SMTZ-45]|nr:MAG: hypothetical protein AM325_16345 [Candidatus Thorarchaeota archaeon SMTZ1-45]KXH77415.1 MAG: hypothetical protein AM326_05135 [Candidatus Thorarchaeota archaeon SMTZ-45]